MGNKTRFVSLISVTIVLTGIIVVLLSGCNNHSSTQSPSYTTDTISRGEVVSSIKAFGTVESEKDRMVLCPERSIIKKVYKTPGNKVSKGELILELDGESVQNEIERMTSQLEVKINAVEKIQLNTESTQLDLKQNEEVKKNRIEKLKTMLTDQENLVKAGTLTENRMERTRQEIDLAEKDLQKLIDKNTLRIAQMEADINGQLLQVETQKANLNDKKALLNKLKVTAPVPGVILEVGGENGSRIEAGRMLVRMSDLSSFKLVGMIDSKYSFQLKTGNNVVVHAEGGDLNGQIGKIIPIMDERMQFDVHLTEKSDPKLIPDQNLPLDIIISDQKNVLRLKKQPEFGNTTRQSLYVVKGKKAIKTEVVFGTVGSDWCEIVSGLNEGDVIITNGPDPILGTDVIDLK
ncbi:efflux RND transporter periplasmic adaptor subunit [Maribellus sp. YY47]|uniref:efflux RND transporter periplasmic adaptor subunit n=1 Tax=Maribellus sp. YY47 TaxID=2929486 RepID=UPI002000E738|nr:efflux RND transporter periplasmic adaptor subunit [Maribellus sp. YY47]MCK3682760.1 efflux RND transporter periplasmic adaptor subunit [Maribellus sp. YY47]